MHTTMFESIEQELSRGDAISIITLVEQLLYEAHELRASDVHIDPTAKDVRVRLRIDGVMQPSHLLPRSIHQEVVSRIKGDHPVMGGNSMTVIFHPASLILAALYPGGKLHSAEMSSPR